MAKKQDRAGYQRGFWDHLFSKLGALFFVSGIAMAFTEDPAVGACLAAAGVLLFLLSARCGTKHLQKFYRKRGVEEAVRQDTAPYELSLKVYNSRPGPGMQRYLRRLNPAAAAAVKAARQKK